LTSKLQPVRIGTAGWSVPRPLADDFPGPGTHLERYARTLPCTEINTTFYRPPMETTWLRWAASVPTDFRFSVKAPKTITHAGLKPTPQVLQTFLAAASLLGKKLGPLLFQLPPKQAFEPVAAEAFLTSLRNLYAGPVALEPRHPSWFSPSVTTLLTSLQIARVAADPARVPEAADPIASPALAYFRLHGSPRIYYSSYIPEYLDQLRKQIRSCSRQSAEVWVIFDNTASGAAAANALDLARSPLL